MNATPDGRFRITVIPSGEPWNENCYLVADTVAGESIIVDPGGRADVICAAAESAAVPVKAIALTHAHHDHARAAAETARHFAVSCYLHSADFRLLRKAPFYSIAFGGRPFPPVANPVALETAQDVALSSGAVRILHTPGHTPGSCCFLFPGFALTGDTLLNHRVGRTDLPGCDRSALLASIDTLLRSVNDRDILYGGHRAPWPAKDAALWWASVRESAPPLDVFERESTHEDAQ